MASSSREISQGAGGKGSFDPAPCPLAVSQPLTSPPKTRLQQVFQGMLVEIEPLGDRRSLKE